MLPTPVCDLLEIDFPIIQAGMGLFTSAELVAAVSNAGGLGILGAGARPVKSLRDHLVKIRELTIRSFAVNLTLSPAPPSQETLSLTLEARPRLISFALADPGEKAKWAHDAGVLVMHQATTVQQAYRAAASGVDMIIAQGSEAGGFGGLVAGMALIPQLVDAVTLYLSWLLAASQMEEAWRLPWF